MSLTLYSIGRIDIMQDSFWNNSRECYYPIDKEYSINKCSINEIMSFFERIAITDSELADAMKPMIRLLQIIGTGLGHKDADISDFIQGIRDDFISKLDFVRNPRAVTALNAISVLTDSTEGLTYRTTKLISDIHHTFAGKRKAVAADFADLNSFKANFNAHNAAAMGVQKKTKLNNKAADLNGRVMK